MVGLARSGSGAAMIREPGEDMRVGLSAGDELEVSS